MLETQGANDVAKKSKVIEVPDIRMVRPLVYHDKATKKSITVQRLEIFDIKNCEISFAAPNNVSIFASIAHKELQQSKTLYGNIIKKNLKKGGRLEIKGKDLTRFYNYLEHVQMSIIAIYTAIESFANLAIPKDFEKSVLNTKGIKEIWDKKAIERHWKTSDKIGDILPEVLQSESPKTLSDWSNFKSLESIRNDIIHQKTAPKKEQGKLKVDSGFVHKLLDEKIFELIESGFSLISFFCKKDISHAYFPMGFSEANLKPIEVEDFTDSFKLYRKADEGEDE
jgi:hypothetical protein